MAWHHIIPFALLNEVWNRLVDQHLDTEVPEARTAVRQYLLLSDRNLPNVDMLIEQMRVRNIEQRRASHYRPQSLSVPEWHQMATAAVWPAWNTVEGPAQRTDDPGNSFDRFIVGLTVEEAARMRVVESLFHHFQTFVNATAGIGSLRAFIQAVNVARPNIYCDMPMRYRPEMWVQVGPKLWRKRRDGEQYNVAGR